MLTVRTPASHALLLKHVRSLNISRRVAGPGTWQASSTAAGITAGPHLCCFHSREGARKTAAARITDLSFRGLKIRSIEIAVLAR